MAVDQGDWEKAIELLDGLGLTPADEGTIGEIAQALTDARAEGYAQAAESSRVWCARAGGCL